MPDCAVNPVQAYLTYSRSLDVEWSAEGCVGWFSYNAVTGAVNSISPRLISG